MGVKIAVSKANKNVLTITDPNDFIFNSDYNTFKILAEGRVLGQTVSGTPTTVNVAHGITGIPVVFAFIKFPDSRVYLPNAYQPTTGTTFERVWTVEVDSTNIIFKIYKNAGSNYSVDIKYYVFETTI